MADSYKILYQGGESETVVKKSRFIATLKPVESEEEAAAFLSQMRKKYWDASTTALPLPSEGIMS